MAYAAAVDRRSRSWAGFSTSVAVWFGAIPVALLFRTLAAQRTQSAELVEMVGRSSLFAFGLGVFTSWIGFAISTRLARRKHYRRLASQLGSRTVVLETSGITLTSGTSHSTWQWNAVTGFSGRRDLLLIWIVQGTAIAIPCRCLDDEGATRSRAGVRPRADGRNQGIGPLSQSAANLNAPGVCRSGCQKTQASKPAITPLITQGKPQCTQTRHRFIGLHPLG